MNIASNKKVGVTAARPLSKLASRAYSRDRISRKARTGSRNGQSMEDIFRTIMTDPDVEIGKSDRHGDQTIRHKGRDIGWINPNRGLGWVDDKAYDRLSPEDTTEDITKSVNDNGIAENDEVRAVEHIENEDDLRQSIKNTLDEDICIDIVNLAFSEDNEFADEAFIESDTFFDTLEYDDPKAVVVMFFNGEDLDSRGAANPNRKYFRQDKKKNVESTDYPGEIYLETLDDKIIDYIIDHISDREYPDKIQELVDEYLENVEA